MVERQSKYRPALSAAQILYLVKLLESQPGEYAVSLCKQLKLFQAKMQLGIVSPAFVGAPKLSIEDKLGLTEVVSDRRKLAYTLYYETPELCTPEEVQLALTFKYENNLMDKEEEEEYEKTS